VHQLEIKALYPITSLSWFTLGYFLPSDVICPHPVPSTSFAVYYLLKIRRGIL